MPRYTHPDYLNGGVTAERRYYAFGASRGGSGILQTENRFTSQKLDGTGLYYYGARYYDPAIGQFVSPDTIVPAPGAVFAYNRYMYAYGNPLRYSDPTGHFSEDQLVEWYSENWRDLFSDNWIKLLLDSPNSQILGAQLGDLVVLGQGNNSTRGVLVLNSADQLTLWDVDNKTPINVGQTESSSLGLYRIAGGETGNEGTRFGYLHGETRYLPATNGSGWGPHVMKLLAEYSTNVSLESQELAGDWFMGSGGQGHFVSNSIAFQEFSFEGPLAKMGGGLTVASAVDLVRTTVQGAKATRLGVGGVIGSVALTAYGSAKYRPVYELTPCSSTGVNYCGR